MSSMLQFICTCLPDSYSGINPPTDSLLSCEAGDPSFTLGYAMCSFSPLGDMTAGQYDALGISTGTIAYSMGFGLGFILLFFLIGWAYGVIKSLFRSF